MAALLATLRQRAAAAAAAAAATAASAAASAFERFLAGIPERLDGHKENRRSGHSHFGVGRMTEEK